MDSFHEQLVTTHKTAKFKAANTATYVFGIAAFLMIGGTALIPGILFLAIAVGLFFLKSKLYVEYEYDFTNGEMDIDKIIEMKRRKRVISFSVKDLELLAPEDSYHIKDYANKPDKAMTLYPETSEAKVWVAILSGTQRAMIRFVPNDELIELCYKYNPRAVKKSI